MYICIYILEGQKIGRANRLGQIRERQEPIIIFPYDSRLALPTDLAIGVTDGPRNRRPELVGHNSSTAC